MTGSDGDRTDTRPRWVKPVLLTIGGILLVLVLFTWVFPWITELGFSPTME